MILGDRYQLGEQLGAGGMANVYRAMDTRLNVSRAVKVLRLGAGEREGIHDRLRAEAQAMARLAHPNVLRIYDVGTDGQVDFIVMELASSGSLADVLTDHGPLAPAEAARAAIQVLSALEAAHRAGIVHRDVKPQNILLDARGAALLADFGIALIGDSGERKTKTNVAMGSLAYMAPEQRLDARSVTPAADIYAVGASVYHLLTDANPIDLFLAEAGSSRWQGVPPALQRVLLRAVRLRPEERYRSAAQMAQELGLLLSTGALPDREDPPRPRDEAVPSVTVSDEATITALDWIAPGAGRAQDTLDLDGSLDGATPSAAFAPTIDESLPGRGTLVEQAPPPVEPAPPPPPIAPWRAWALRGGAAAVTALGVALLAWRALLPSPPEQADAAPPAGALSEAPSTEAPPTEAPEVTATPAAEPSTPEPPAPEQATATEPLATDAPRPRRLRTPLVDRALSAPATPAPGAEAPEGSVPAPRRAARTAVNGTWTGVFNGLPAELRLEADDEGQVKGELSVRYSGSSPPVVNRVHGGYDAGTQTLTLNDTDDVDDAGRYTASLSRDGARLDGQFIARRNGAILPFQLNRKAP